MGVGLRPWPADPAALLAAVDGLGLRHALLRLHPWADDHRAEEELARELAARGVELTFTLPQNRDLVRDLGRWRGAIAEIAERFTPFGRRFQVGQAINRSKWGVWTLREYLDLAAVAAEALRARPGVELLGPAVIDFEFHATAAALNSRRTAVEFDGVASLLYVDRRGAPERRQMGFDTVGKVTLLKAIAETARASGPGSWITEVNWPLREGPHSPAGRSVAVDEETQADYLVRYYLLALCTGLVDGVFGGRRWRGATACSPPRRAAVCAGAPATGRWRPSWPARRHLLRGAAGRCRAGPALSLPPRRRRRAGGRVVGRRDHECRRRRV